MADKPKRRIKAAQTVREKAQNNNQAKPKKPKRLLKLRSAIAFPFKTCSLFLGKFKTMRFIGRILVPRYIRDSWKEIKLVDWPSRKESLRLTLAVLMFAIVFGAIVASLDFGLGRLFRDIILGKHG